MLAASCAPPRPCTGELRVIYRITPEFSEREAEVIREAMTAWEEGTRGWACFLPGLSGIRFVRVTSPAEVADVDARNGVTVWGYWRRRDLEVGLLVDRIGSYELLGMVARHEIGHALGLPHTRGNVRSWMHPAVDGAEAGDLPEYDRARLCRMHGCDWR